MRVIIQKVSRASVKTGDRISGSIGAGLLILVGIEEADTTEDIEWLAGKVCRLRIFPDGQGVMNLSVMDIGGQILLVSQFTLHASTKKGNRPSYVKAAKTETAIPLYESLIRRLSEELGSEIKTGEFGAMMQVELVIDGPVTIMMDSKNRE